MDEPAVSIPTANSLVKVTVIYQIGPMDLYAVFIATCLRNRTRAASQLSMQLHFYGCQNKQTPQGPFNCISEASNHITGPLSAQAVRPLVCFRFIYFFRQHWIENLISRFISDQRKQSHLEVLINFPEN